MNEDRDNTKSICGLVLGEESERVALRLIEQEQRKGKRDPHMSAAKMIAEYAAAISLGVDIPDDRKDALLRLFVMPGLAAVTVAICELQEKQEAQSETKRT